MFCRNVLVLIGDRFVGLSLQVVILLTDIELLNNGECDTLCSLEDSSELDCILLGVVMGWELLDEGLQTESLIDPGVVLEGGTSEYWDEGMFETDLDGELSGKSHNFLQRSEDCTICTGTTCLCLPNFGLFPATSNITPKLIPVDFIWEDIPDEGDVSDCWHSDSLTLFCKH